MIIEWKAKDGSHQKVNLKNVLALEQSNFIKYIDNLPKVPSNYQTNKALKMLKDIEHLEKLIKEVETV